jgi:1-phosphatidylinositol-3-phosphate 5-kinase
LGRFKGAPEDRAPFRRGIDEDAAKKPKFPAFHDDNIIDPELADYMSDESSGDEQMGLFSTMSGPELPPETYEHDKNNLSGSFNSGRRHRHRAGEKSISGISGRGAFDDMNGPPSLISLRRPNRRRNLSNVSGSIHHLVSPRPKSAVHKGPSVSSEMLFAMEHHGQAGTQLTRSDSLHHTRTPKVELNNSSLRHVHKLLSQLLEDAGIPDPLPWQNSLVPTLLQATDDVDPDVSQGEDMDIRHYVKLKRIPGGKPGDTSYVSGVVFTKNLALKSMARKITNPRIILVTFPLEYQRHQQHFMSLQPVIEQEKEYLRVVVQRITNLRPNVLLAEKGVSGVALQYLSDANISVAYNVKHTVIEAVARCAETEIITSRDMLALPIKVGRCASFDVRTFVNNDYPGRKKSYIFLSGCRPDLGCTISLRGADHSVLGRIKQIVEFMVYVVYNLRLESSLLRNESIEPPDSGEVSLSNSILAANESFRSASAVSVVGNNGPTVVLNEASESEPPSQNTVESSSIAGTDLQGGLRPSDEAGPGNLMPPAKPVPHTDDPDGDQTSQVPDDVPMPTYYSDMVAKYETKILSASPYVKFSQPYLLMRAREQERRLLYLRRLLDHDAIEQREVQEQERIEAQRRKAKEESAMQDGEEKDEQEGVEGEEIEIAVSKKDDDPEVKSTGDIEGSGTQRFQLIKPEMVEKIGQKAPKQMMEILHAVHDAEYDKALFNYQTQTRHWETYIQGNLDLFDPYSHQNIVVLYSVVCTGTKIPCTEPGLVALNFYDEQRYDPDMYPDCTLGQYIEDLVYSKEDICNSNGCEKKMMEHHRTYVHDQSCITVFVENFPHAPPRKPDLGDGITMWTYCKICKKDSEETAMSTATFKYSFGKYLELLYWGRGLRMKDTVQCPHDHHKDHVRYFSLDGARVRIHWDPIDLLEIVVPRARITWKVANDLRLKNEIYTKMEDRWTRFMTSVKIRLKSIRIDSVLPDKAESCKDELERLTKKAQEDESAMIRELQDIYVNSKYYEVVPFNKIVRRMLEVVSDWDAAFAKFEADFLGDKDMRQLTMMQLKKMFENNESKESLVSNEGTGSVGDSEEPASQTFSEADEKSTQPTEYTANTSTEGSALSVARANDEKHPPDEDGKVEILAEGVIERVEPLDLAGSPVSMKKGSPHSDAISKIPSPPQPTSPRPPSTPTGASRANTDIPPPGPFLAEKVDQKRREKAIQSTDTGASTPVPSSAKQTAERRTGRRTGDETSPPLLRTTSQPARPLPRSQSSSGKANAIKDGKSGSAEQHDQHPPEGSIKVDKKLSERLGLSALKNRSKNGPSSIPRLVQKRPSKVSTLAKHFEQLSREFEKERIRDRKQRAASERQPRAMLPRTSTRAVVEVYDDVNDAFVDSPQPNKQSVDRDGEGKQPEKPSAAGEETPKVEQTQTPVEEGKTTAQQDKQAQTGGAEKSGSAQPGQGGSDDEGVMSDTETAVPEEYLPGIKEIADSLEPTDEIPEELPKHQKTSLMRYLTNFWAERSASGWPMLDYPVTGNDHIFVDSDIIVREDEPSSVIALALNSEDYKYKLAQIRAEGQASAREEEAEGLMGTAPGSVPISEGGDLMDESELEKSLLRATGTHLKYSFKDRASVMTCRIFYAEQFDALRRKCGVAERIVESLSRCLKWDSKGGKTKSVFLKTLDDRLVLKSLSPVEASAFLRFAPGYFSIMAEALFHDLPSVIAKMVGFFQVLIKNPSTGVDIRLDLLVTENLFYDRSPTRIFDLKGSMRNRKIQSTGEQNEVLLDENMVEYIYESPLFAREHSKKLLRASVWNDTLFLARQNVMDYSLMIAVDEDRKELVVGIIDCIRTYTWDKKLESWIKDRGFAGGGRNRPTVTSPKEYKNRFREAMARFALPVLVSVYLLWLYS